MAQTQVSSFSIVTRKARFLRGANEGQADVHGVLNLNSQQLEKCSDILEKWDFREGCLIYCQSKLYIL